MTTMQVFNQSRLLMEPATVQQCRRCRGFGHTLQDAQQDDRFCYLCGGDGELAISESGWTRRVTSPDEDSQLY